MERLKLWGVYGVTWARNRYGDLGNRKQKFAQPRGGPDTSPLYAQVLRGSSSDSGHHAYGHYGGTAPKFCRFHEQPCAASRG